MTASSSILSEVDELHGRFQFTESYEKFSEWMENNESDELSLELQSRWARTLYYYGKSKLSCFRGLRKRDD